MKTPQRNGQSAEELRVNLEKTPAIRPLTPENAGILGVATLGNMNWCGERFTCEDIQADPVIAHYTVFDPERGDFGFIMTRDSVIIGMAWAQFLGRGDPGYGFVDDGVPEVSLWVSPEDRGTGHGRRLLQRLLLESSSRGHGRLSLSVESGNRARDLYTSEGFVPVPGREQDGVMLWRVP